MDTRYQPLRHDAYPYRQDDIRALVAPLAGSGALARLAGEPPDLPPRLGGVLAVWFRRWADRCELRWIAETYPDHLLDDIGLTRDAIWREARKPLWRR